MTPSPDPLPSIAVVFLARGMDGGAGNAEDFFESYDRFRPKISHQLVVAVKGWEAVNGLDRVCREAQLRGAKLECLPDDGLDWGAYGRLAIRLSVDWICFLNSHSRILCGNWLEAMAAAMRVPEIGAVGATGSYGTLRPHVINCWTDWVYFSFRYLRMASRFPAFPNPHLRSNAFLTRRDLFIDYFKLHRIPQSKEDAHMMECGHHSYCRFLRTRGYIFVVAGRDGRLYPPESWIESATFCVGDQHNLLIADNRTEQFRCGDTATRDFLERSIWGRRVTT